MPNYTPKRQTGTHPMETIRNPVTGATTWMHQSANRPRMVRSNQQGDPYELLKRAEMKKRKTRKASRKQRKSRKNRK